MSGKGIKFILQACRTLFNFALKRRYLSPYMDNPFSVIEIDRMPTSDGRRHRLVHQPSLAQDHITCSFYHFHRLSPRPRN